MMNRAGRMLLQRGNPVERVAGMRLRAAAPTIPSPVGSATPNAAAMAASPVFSGAPPPNINAARSPVFNKGGRVDGKAIRGRTRGKLV